MADLRRVDDVDRVKQHYGVQGGKVLKQQIGGLESRLQEQVLKFSSVYTHISSFLLFFVSSLVAVFSVVVSVVFDFGCAI